MRDVRWVDLPPDFIGPMRNRRNRDFEVVGAGYFEARNDTMSSPLEVVKDASLTSLKHAFARYAQGCLADPKDPLPLFVSDLPPDMFDADFGPYDSVHLDVNASEIDAVVTVEVEELPASSRPVWELLSPLLDRLRAGPVGIERIDGWGTALKIDVAIPSRGRTVGDALEIGHEVERLLQAAYSQGAELTAPTVADLLRTGHGDVLTGQPENDWLDVKSRVYELGEDYGKLQLAKDVASFANAGGGVIAIGVSSSRTRRGETVGPLRPVDITNVSTARFRAILRDWLHPRLNGLRIDVIPTGSHPDRGIVVIEIPPQSPAALPFMVRKTDIGGKIRDQHFTIPVRVADDNATWDLGEIHSLIVAGRAALGALEATTSRNTARPDEPAAP
jgi:hypothetical protein